MTSWSLPTLLEGLHEEIHRRLETVNKTMGHPSSKGDASEKVWLELLQQYLPKRYQAAKAHIVDSKGSFSQQIDVAVFDRQYTPFIFNVEDASVVPAEAVYAVFEAKQSINATKIRYAREKIKSVRGLVRTSLPIPHAGGTYPAKVLTPILGGILTFNSDWSPGLGDPFRRELAAGDELDRIDVGCVAAHGHFFLDPKSGFHQIMLEGRPATAFLFKLISMLQASGTVPMIDIEAYGDWLTK